MDRRLLTLALGMFALGTDSFVFGGILPSIAKHFYVSIGAAGQLITVYALTFALLAPTIAALAGVEVDSRQRGIRAGLMDSAVRPLSRRTMLKCGAGLLAMANSGCLIRRWGRRLYAPLLRKAFPGTPRSPLPRA